MINQKCVQCSQTCQYQVKSRFNKNTIAFPQILLKRTKELHSTHSIQMKNWTVEIVFLDYIPSDITFQLVADQVKVCKGCSIDHTSL